MKPEFEWVEVAGVRGLAEDTWVLDYHRPAEAESVRPGQFCMIRPMPGTSDVFLPRPFSYYNATDEGRVEILFRTFGRATRWMASLAEGDRIGVFGPLGNTFDFPESADRAILVAGGIGLPPMEFLARRLARLRGGLRVDLIYGEVQGSRVVDMAGTLPDGVELHLATEDGAAGHRGLVTDIFVPLLAACDEPPAVYCCGPNAMMAVLANMVSPRKVELFQASMEEHMACGKGICQGCVIPLEGEGDEDFQYVRCCTEGPVFNGFEVAWTMC